MIDISQPASHQRSSCLSSHSPSSLSPSVSVTHGAAYINELFYGRHHPLALCRCGSLLRTPNVAWSVRLCVGQTGGLCKNGWTDQWGADSSIGPGNGLVLIEGTAPPTRDVTFLAGTFAGRLVVKYLRTTPFQPAPAEDECICCCH